MLESKITKEYLDLKSLQKSLLTHMIQFSHCLFVTNLELWVDMYVLPWDRLFVLASIVKPWVEPVFHGIFTLSWEYGTFLIHSTSKHLLRWILNNKIELNFSYAYADSDLFWLQSALPLRYTRLPVFSQMLWYTSLWSEKWDGSIGQSKVRFFIFVVCIAFSCPSC